MVQALCTKVNNDAELIIRKTAREQSPLFFAKTALQCRVFFPELKNPIATEEIAVDEIDLDIFDDEESIDINEVPDAIMD